MTPTAPRHFNQLSLRPELIASVEALNYTEMTPIQSGTLPLILDNKDVLAQAKTGSGKTAAFALGLLNKLDIKIYQTQALVLCPTRELSDQVAAEIRRLASTLSNTKVLTLCGGKPMHEQLASLKRSSHVVVGTPGRILKHLEKETLSLEKIHTLVLDEADRMLDMGFYDDIMKLIRQTNKVKQTLLFSATYPDEIQNISTAIQNDPLQVRVETAHTENQIHQVFYSAEEPDKKQILLSILDTNQFESTIVFCNRKQHCQELAEALIDQGYAAKALHGDLEQYERDEAMILFTNNSISILVATDVAARGLDISELSAVINFDMSHDAETHVHRIGRTGRAGNEGQAINLVLPKEDYKVEEISDFLSAKFPIETFDTTAKRSSHKLLPSTITLRISGGKKDKVRPGDIVGALTASDELSKEQIGKITVLQKIAYVAVNRSMANTAHDILSGGKIKGRRFKVKALR